MSIVSKILGAGQDKLVKQYEKKVAQINAMEPEIASMGDEEICTELQSIRQRIEQGGDPNEFVLRVFALGREHIRRTTGKRAYDVQLIGALALNDGCIAELATGEGKQVPTRTLVPTPDGWRAAGDIRVGDMLFGPDGKPTRVLGVYPQGENEVYELTLKDGRSIECGDEHLWSVYDGYKATSLTTLTTREMYENGVIHQKGRGYQYHLPVSNAVDYEPKVLSLDPYAMGLMLGDGCRNSHRAFEMSCSKEDVSNVEAVSKSIGAVHFKPHKGCCSWHFYSEFNGDGRGNHNKYLRIDDVSPEYTELLSEKYCHEKWIPNEYKMASIEQRWALVQGLMDSDGNIYAGDKLRYNMQFSTTSEKLRDDFMEILYSLGISCSYRVSRKAGVRNAKRDQYTVLIHAPHELKPNFFRLKRKHKVAIEAASRPPKKKRYDRIAVTDIKKTGEFTEQVCFSVEHPSHLFLIGRYIVTHNTLTTNFAILMNAIAGKQVHVVTVNEYLSGRDAELCREALEGTGVTVGYIYNQQQKAEKVEAYACDVVYGTPSEFGFDYLRDNMVSKAEDKVQKHHDYAIIDEIDSILIDEARTPLIISGAGSKNTDIYRAFALAVQGLYPRIDYEKDEAKKTIAPTESGLAKVERALGIDDLYSSEYNQLPRYLKQALAAQFLYHRDKDYIVDGGEVKIVDPNTGRIMEGRRWSEGLHQAIEAKERVDIQQENDTLATVTLQNFFRLYDKLSGCTGTAMTEDAEFRKTYGMGVVSVPTNRPVIRQDLPDVVYKGTAAKLEAIAEKVEELHAKGQPVLVGTVSVANSERLSRLLGERGIGHFTLNAKNHAKEAHIVAQAGRLGAVTIATNMAGRGTDIMLGGNADEMLESYKAAVIAQREADPVTGKVDTYIPDAELAEAKRQIEATCKNEKELVLAAGGLAVIGSERHESRRIDNQLRGRAGRQGDPGYSQFYISLEDDLMRLFGKDRIAAIKGYLDKAEVPDGEPLDAPMVSKAVERAQRQVESIHFDGRKNTLEYDDVLNKQRLAIYAERDMLIGADAIDADIRRQEQVFEPDKNDVGDDIWDEGYLDAVDDNLADVASGHDAFEAAYKQAVEERVAEMQAVIASELTQEHCPATSTPASWDWEGLREAYAHVTGKQADEILFIGEGSPGMGTAEDVESTLLWNLSHDWDVYCQELGRDEMESIVKDVMLSALDSAWKDHLNYMDYLKSGVGMRSYGQRDPLTEYKDEAYNAFEFMVDTMYRGVLESAFSTASKMAAAKREEAAAEAQAAVQVAMAGRTAIPGAALTETFLGTSETSEMQVISIIGPDGKPVAIDMDAVLAAMQPQEKAVLTDDGEVAAIKDEHTPVVAAGGMGDSFFEENAGLGDAELVGEENQ